MESRVAGDAGNPVGELKADISVPSNFGKLKPGPGLAAVEVGANQRLRLRTAMTELVFDRGFEGVTVRNLSRLAGVSTATFYRHFANTETCLAFASEVTMREMVDRADRIRRESGDWQAGMRAVVSSLVEQMSERPQDAKLTMLAVHTGGTPTRRAAVASARSVENVLVELIKDAPPTVVAPRRLVSGMVAGLFRVIRTTTIAGEAGELVGLSGQLADWMLALPGPDVMSLRSDAKDRSATRRWRERPAFPDDVPTNYSPAPQGDRGRILAASGRLALVEGVADLTVPMIRREAGVSRRSFDANFADATDAVLSAVEHSVIEAVGRAAQWAAQANHWPQRIYLTIVGLCAQVARRHSPARIALADLEAQGQPGLLCRERLLSRAASVLRDAAPRDQRPRALAAEASASAAWRIAQVEHVSRGSSDLPSVAPLLAYVLLRPAVGQGSTSDLPVACSTKLKDIAFK